jgi:hypothetical protein
MYAELGNDEWAEMHLKFQDLRNPSVFVTTPNVGRTGLNITATHHVVIPQKFGVSNKQLLAFARVVWLVENRVPHTWLLDMGSGGYNYRTCDLCQYIGVAQMSVLHGLMSQPKIMTSIIYHILESRKDHTMRLTENGDTFQTDQPSS